MTEDEVNDASAALVAWFKSQDMSPQDAVVVMTSVITGIFSVSKNTKIEIITVEDTKKH
jgi:hypothetical protein